MYDLGVNGAIILSGHNGYRPFVGSVGVEGDRITSVTEGEIKSSQCKKWIDGTGKILMPGLVNGHCHGDMTLARGFGDDLTLWEQNERFADHNWFSSFIDEEDRYYSRQLTYCEALLSGTTFLLENMYWGLGDASMQAMKETGIRGGLAEDIRVDFVNPDGLRTDEELKCFMEQCRFQGQIPVIGTVSEEDFETRRLLKIQEKLKPFEVLQTCHLAENAWRVDLIRTTYDTTPIDYLYRNGLLGERLIGSHVVFASPQEIEQLAKTQTKVVNTPLCEMKIADGIAPIPEMVKAGVTVCLGTDGAMWNNSNDLFREMKGMSLLHTIHSGIRSLSQKDILDMATINGAKVFGMEKDYGTIEAGKKGDFILIETRVPHMRPLRMGNYENVGSTVIYNATGRDVTDVFVGGQQVVGNRRLLTMDLETVIKKVQNASDKIAAALSL